MSQHMFNGEHEWNALMFGTVIIGKLPAMEIMCIVATHHASAGFASSLWTPLNLQVSTDLASGKSEDDPVGISPLSQLKEMFSVHCSECIYCIVYIHIL